MDASSTQPIYQQIAQSLRALIAQGTLQPGDVLPSAPELAGQWSAAVGTARQALAELEREGLVSGGRTRRVIRHQPLTVHITRPDDLAWAGESPTMGADAWVGDMNRAGRPPSHQIEVITQLADGVAAERLQLRPDETMIARRLVRLAGGSPHNLVTFWFPGDIAEGTLLAQPASITEGSVAWLDRTRGPLTHEMEISSRMPGTDETKQLNVPYWVPVTAVWRVARSAVSGRALMASMAAYPADRAVLRLVL